jgi:hypothetical protein
MRALHMAGVIRSKPDLIILDLLTPDVSVSMLRMYLKKTLKLELLLSFLGQDKAMLNGPIHNIIVKVNFNNETFRLNIESIT